MCMKSALWLTDLCVVQKITVLLLLVVLVVMSGLQLCCGCGRRRMLEVLRVRQLSVGRRRRDVGPASVVHCNVGSHH